MVATLGNHVLHFPLLKECLTPKIVLACQLFLPKLLSLRRHGILYASGLLFRHERISRMLPHPGESKLNGLLPCPKLKLHGIHLSNLSSMLAMLAKWYDLYHIALRSIAVQSHKTASSLLLLLVDGHAGHDDDGMGQEERRRGEHGDGGGEHAPRRRRSGGGGDGGGGGAGQVYTPWHMPTQVGMCHPGGHVPRGGHVNLTGTQGTVGSS